MQETVIRGWDELQSAIFQDVWDPVILRYRNNCVYRGMADIRWGLLPSLNRVCGHDLTLEKPMLRSFKKYGYADLRTVSSFWQLLAMAQQFGLPTRLLDWTYSPLVAAHFATEDQNAYDRDGVIWCVNVDRVNLLLPQRLKDMLQAERCNIFSMEMMDRVGDGFDALKAVSSHPFGLFFEPASAVNRIANQYALFSLCSDPTATLDALPGSEDCFRRIVIPAQVKLEIRDKLDYINISERMIYPGLDGICKWITRRYAALGPLYNSKNWLRDEREGAFMDRTSTVELTNLCMICQGDRILVQEKIWNGEKGIIFPGGHVEKYESLHASVIREMQEETGLTVENPAPCGFKDWINEDGSRYLVLLYKADRFTGVLRSSEEGRVFWVTREEFERLPVMWNMREALQILDSDRYSECFWPFGSHDCTLLG